MGMEIQGQSKKSAIVKRDLVSEKLRLNAVMASIERDHRTEFSQAELDQWEALLEHPEKFTLTEIMAALDETQLHPPDGWTGPPKRTDVIRQMFRAREARAEDIARHGGRTLADQECKLCGGTSWKPVSNGQSEKKQVTRCDCWLRNRRQIA